MTDHYEDTDDQKERVLSNRQVLAFMGGYWLRRRWLLAITVGLTLISIGFDLSVPWAAGKLVNAVADGVGQLREAWRSWALLAGVYGAGLIIRNIAMRAWIPLAASNMKEIIDEAFQRVLDNPAAQEALQHPALKPLLEQAAD